jgi:drug/metabolite transporter (DMT)-like permease
VSLRLWLLLSLAAFGWGLGGVITRAAFDQGVDPVEFSAYRTGFAVVTVLGVMALQRPRPVLGREAWHAGLVLGVVNLATPFLLLTLAVVYASAGFVGLLVANVPVGTAIWAHALNEERLNSAKALGLSISSAGVLFLLVSGDTGIGEDGNALAAIALTLAGLAAASFGIIHAKRVIGGMSPSAIALPQFVVGALLLAAPIPFTDGAPTDFTATGWLLVAAAGVFATAMPFLVFYAAMKHVTATQASLTGYVIPIVAIVLGAWWLDEQVTASIVIGGLLILVGVILTDRAAARSTSGDGLD